MVARAQASVAMFCGQWRAHTYHGCMKRGKVLGDERLLATDLLEMILRGIFQTRLNRLQTTRANELLRRPRGARLTGIGCVDAIACLSARLTASNCFVVAGEDIRMAFGALLIRIGLVSRAKYVDECGDRLVPAEFGGVRCLLGLSSVCKVGGA